MIGIFLDVVKVLIGAVGGSLVTYLFSRSEREKERTPRLRFEFSDLQEHEGLGAVGFRHIQSKVELRISGTIRNVGTALAENIKLDIYHFMSSKKMPIHEIAEIRIADALSAGEYLQWNKSIRLADLTVDGPYYKSGTTGIFSDNTRGRHYHYHVVFSCANSYGEVSSTVYCAEKILDNNVFKGNKMIFIRQVKKYRPMKQFPSEWRKEIELRERATSVR